MLYFTPPQTTHKNPFDVARFNLAWRLCSILSVVFAILCAIYVYKNEFIFMDYAITLVLSTGLMVYMSKTHKYKLSFLVISISGTILPFYTAYFEITSIHYASFLWITFVMLVTFYGLGVRYGILYVIFNVAGYAYYSVFLINDNIDQMILLDTGRRIALAIELGIITLLTGYVFRELITLYKTSEDNLLDANKVLENQNEEKTILIKEIHHRVKNNLQIIISLLRMQRSELKSEEAKEQFNEAIKRIMTMSLIHQKLYQEKELAKINIQTYINELYTEIESIYSHEQPIKLDFNSTIDNIDLKTIVPLGLLLNELISNSFKYAFKNSRDGKITATIKPLDKVKFELKYSDNGQWEQPADTHTSFGLELIEILTEQLEGDFKLKIDESGTHYTFELKNLGN